MGPGNTPSAQNVSEARLRNQHVSAPVYRKKRVLFPVFACDRRDGWDPVMPASPVLFKGMVRMPDVSDRFSVGSMSCSSRRKPVVFLLARRIWLVGLSPVENKFQRVRVQGRNVLETACNNTLKVACLGEDESVLILRVEASSEICIVKLSEN